MCDVCCVLCVFVFMFLLCVRTHARSLCHHIFSGEASALERTVHDDVVAFMCHYDDTSHNGSGGVGGGGLAMKAKCSSGAGDDGR